MEPLNDMPMIGLAAKIDTQYWSIYCEADYIKSIMLMCNLVSFFKDGKFHRENGPAIAWKDGHTEWRLNDKLHRADGPAIIMADGTEFWLLKGKLHREDGPAIIRTSGYKAWYKNGEFVKHEAT